MKVRLTEAQFRRMKLITEGEERLREYYNIVEKIEEKVNNIYTRLSFSTLAEILEGDVDVSVMYKKLEEFENLEYKFYKNVNDFFQYGMGEDEYYDKWSDADTEVGNKHQELVYDKIDPLKDLCEALEKIIESKVADKFTDIKKMNL